VKNAFNSVNRSTLLSEIQNTSPGIYPYLYQCYGAPTNLVYRNNNILSSVGCQQGDPLGPAIFSLAIHPIISTLNSKFNVWYLDDGSLGGDASSVSNDLSSIINKFNSIGLELNTNKCELFINTDTPNKSQIQQLFENICPGINILQKNSLHLLGAPVFEESIPDFINTKINRFSEFSARLLEINAHMAICILRFCMFVPKFTYALRCSPIWKFPNYSESIDSMLHLQLQKILNVKINNRQFLHATLPIRFGGLGIRQISGVALPAFLSSAHSTLTLVGKILRPSLRDFEVTYMSEAEDAWKMACPGVDLPTNKSIQKIWDQPICKQVHSHLLDSCATTQEKARLLALSERESGSWLHALPSTNYGTLLDCNTLRLAVGLRLGAEIVSPHRCPCGILVGSLGHHGLSCAKSAGRLSRHACLNDIIRRAFVSANVPAVLEPPGLARDDGKRPDGMTLVPWKMGRPLIWDATCVDTLAPSHLGTTSLRAGGAAAAAEAAKCRKYIGLTDRHVFAAFAVETLGPWSPGAHELFGQLSKNLIKVSGDHRAGSFLAQRIGIAIQRGNAASLMGTLPQGSDLGDFN
jgi:hypothetical protein